MAYDALVHSLSMENQAGLPEGFKVIKLPPNGPKPGQSTNAWLYGKGKEEKEFQKLIDAQSFKGKRK
jgi:hypothetical protein